MKKIITTTFLFFVFLAVKAPAQEVLSLERSRQMALNHNEDLRIARMQIDKAQEERAAARTFRLPAFSASGTGIYQDQDFDMELILPTQVPDPATGELVPNFMLHPVTGEPVIGPDGNPVFNMYGWLPLEVSLNGAYIVGLNMEQPLYTGGKINAGNRMADIGLNMAHDNLSLQRMNTILATDHAYWTFISVTEQVKLAEQAVKMLEEFVQLARNSYEVGLASRNDLLKAQVEYNNAKLNMQKARNGLELSRMQLCRVTGLPFDMQIIAADTLIDTSQPVPDALEKINLHQRPEYRLLEHNIRMSEQNIRMARAEFLPAVGFQAGYTHIGGVEFSGTEFSNTSLNVIGSVKIPLFHWGQGVRKIRSARIDMEMREIELEKNRQLMQLEAEQARLNLLLAWERIQMNEDALEQAKENLRMSRDNYEVGAETITDLLMAQTQWQQAYSELISARTGFRITETEWLKATGKLLE